MPDSIKKFPIPNAKQREAIRELTHGWWKSVTYQDGEFIVARGPHRWGQHYWIDAAGVVTAGKPHG